MFEGVYPFFKSLCEGFLFLSFLVLFQGFLSLRKGHVNGFLSFFKMFLRDSRPFFKGLFKGTFFGSSVLYITAQGLCLFVDLLGI